MIITYQAKLLERIQLTKDVFFASFSKPADPSWNFLAGQYMIFHIPQANNHPARRLYSIASSPSQTESLDFIIEMVPNGVGSTHIHNMQIGAEVTLQGPAGMFVFKSQERTPVFLATGTGIAPIYSIIYEYLKKGYDKPIYLYWGLKTSQDLYIHEELDRLASEHANFYHQVCLSREENMDEIACFMKGHINDGFEAMLQKTATTPEAYDYYLCGSKHVVESLREYLAQKNAPKEQVHFEKFTT